MIFVAERFLLAYVFALVQLRNESLFTGFIGNESQCGTSKLHETQNQFSCDLFAPHPNSFPMKQEK